MIDAFHFLCSFPYHLNLQITENDQNIKIKNSLYNLPIRQLQDRDIFYIKGKALFPTFNYQGTVCARKY